MNNFFARRIYFGFGDIEVVVLVAEGLRTRPWTEFGTSGGRGLGIRLGIERIYKVN